MVLYLVQAIQGKNVETLPKTGKELIFLFFCISTKQSLSPNSYYFTHKSCVFKPLYLAAEFLGKIFWSVVIANIPISLNIYADYKINIMYWNIHGLWEIYFAEYILANWK